MRLSKLVFYTEERLSIGDGVVVARRGARRLDSKGCGPETVRGEIVIQTLDRARRGPGALILVQGSSGPVLRASSRVARCDSVIRRLLH